MDSPYPPPPPPPDQTGGTPAAVATCYRHADRPTRLSCSSCGRPICVDCTNPAAVGQKCPECAAPTGRSRIITAAEVRQGSTGVGGAPVTRAILGVTIAIGVIAYVLPGLWNQIAGALIDNVQLVERGEIWRTVGAALLHSPRSLFHIGFNMYALYAFGPQLERRFGSVPFLLFYVASAAAGGLGFQVVRDTGQALGASGAIFGLFGGYVMSAYLSRHTAAGQAGLRQLMPLLLINLALPIFVPSIAWEAHVGGLLAGALIMAAWRGLDDGAGVEATRRVRLRRALIAGGVLVVCLGLLLVV